MSTAAPAETEVDPEADADTRAAIEQFRSGDFGGARRALLALRQSAPSETTRRAADRAFDRLRPDPVALLLLLACLIAFVVLIALTR